MPPKAKPSKANAKAKPKAASKSAASSSAKKAKVKPVPARPASRSAGRATAKAGRPSPQRNGKGSTPATKKAAASAAPKAAAPARSTAKAGKYVYYFGDGKADGNRSMKNLLGGKGANLAEMTQIGLPVPPGFTISTEVCIHFMEHGKYPKELEEQIDAAMKRIEKSTAKSFSSPGNPLLVSVRSGARDSMPGMMDTILNLGLNDETVIAVAQRSNNERFAYDCYRRFIQMYGDVVMGIQKRPGEDHEPFEVVIDGLKSELFPGQDHVEDTELDVDALKELVKRFKNLIKERTGQSFPNQPRQQLYGAIGAVFRSWNNDRAIVYRRKYGIPDEWGTACNVQAMVFGNTGDQSCSGVAFTRDPANGEKVFYGEFLINAQGEDVVAGVRTPEPVANLQAKMPKAFRELTDVRKTLESHFRDVQDFEFTVEDNKLYMLQTRNGKRTGLAAVKIAVDMVREKLISWEEAILRVPADSLSHLLAPIFDSHDRQQAHVIATGLPAGPGAATGKIVLNATEADQMARAGEKVLLVRVETSPEDIRGMLAAEGILTSRGGVSSHAALVARQMGKVCVCGASAIRVDYERQQISVGDRVYKKGEFLSIDGTTGEIFAGEVKTAPSEVIQVLIDKSLDPKEAPTFQYFDQLMKWADKTRVLGIRTNADQPDQVHNAVAFGAEGIGLCRTEHMFFGGDRIDAVREMILAESKEAREGALAKLLPFQRDDFTAIFEALNGLPATIRLLDPPLHEFLPHDSAAQNALAEKLGVSPERVAKRVHELHEFNPMLGHRGCRLGVVFPEISAMQARAIFEAAASVQKKGIKVKPEIMIPLVGFPKELRMQLAVVHREAQAVQKEMGIKLKYQVGTMVEIPRACVAAAEIAKDAEFFSFGTNDLTQTTLGMSRDDSGSFLPYYQEQEIVKANPFASIDEEGVGELMKLAITNGRATRPDIKLGICGEHGGDPRSVKFCHAIGLAYVSCSPFRVPVARLAAAQAATEAKLNK